MDFKTINNLFKSYKFINFSNFHEKKFFLRAESNKNRFGRTKYFGSFCIVCSYKYEMQ